MDKQALSDITVFNKYAKFNASLNRRENWTEIVDRNLEMHKVKYPKIAEKISEIYNQFVHTKKVLPSMRSLQFGGKPILMAHNRIFNCAYMPLEMTKFYAELMFLLLGGTGMGYSVQRRHTERLPKVKAPESDSEYKFQVQDSIIGWSDAIKVVAKAFFNAGTLPVFDYRDIREKGEDLITSGGKAPGPDPLRTCIENIIPIFRGAIGRQLRPIEAHDISCIVADAVLAGGIRRAAMIVLFDLDDEEMITSKSVSPVKAYFVHPKIDAATQKVDWTNVYGVTGSAELDDYTVSVLLDTGKLPWYLVHPARARANNSAVLKRGEVTEEQFRKLVKRIEESGCGEPGVFWTNNKDWGTNPCCVSGDTWVMTDNGAAKASELVGKSFNVLIDGVEHPVAEGGFWETGTKPIYEVTTKKGHTVKLTLDHRLKKITHKTAKSLKYVWSALADIAAGDSIMLSAHKSASWGSFSPAESDTGYILGHLVGDGTFSHTEGKNDFACLDFWGPDADQMSEETFELLKGVCDYRADLGIIKAVSNCGTKRRIASRGLATLAEGYGIVRGNKTITEAVERTSSEFHIGFLRGLFDTDGCPQGSQQKGVSVRLTQANLSMLQAAQRMLLRLGINSSIYSGRNAEGMRMMPDGFGGLKDYWCKEVHELVIANSNVITFADRIGFNEPAKIARLDTLLGGYKRTPNRDRFDDEVISITYVGDEKVYDVTVPSNPEFCANGIQAHNCEISLRPYQMCNLTEINAGVITDQASFNDAAGAAAFLGTLQAGYTDFHYLNPKWRMSCEKEALLGVSMTGIASGAIEKLDSEEAAKYAVRINKETAALIGINPAARVTTVKPAGTTSLVLGTSSGIHAWHAPYYIRRMRAGKSEALAQYMQRAVPGLVEDDVMNDKQVVLSFPQKAPEGATLRDEPMMSMLERVKRVSTEWVGAGHISGVNRHNVSCTISVKNDEWEELANWMWVNRENYSGISVLPYFGAAAYPQLPFEDISKEQYEAMLPLLEGIDISQVFEDNGSGVDLKSELACAGGVCELI